MSETNAFANISDLEELWRTLSADEKKRAEKLLDVVSDSLRQEAYKVGKDLDNMLEEKKLLPNVLKSVTVDVVARTLMTSTNQEPVAQVSQSGLGFSASATYLVPGGGLFIKKSELSRLGLRKQRIGAIDIYGTD